MMNDDKSLERGTGHCTRNITLALRYAENGKAAAGAVKKVGLTF
jgi:hypothetical protein